MTNNSRFNIFDSDILFGYDIYEFNGDLTRLKQVIESERCIDSYKGLRIAEWGFKYPYLRCVDYKVIALGVMRLLMKFGYTQVFENGRFTIGYKLNLPTIDVYFTIGPAISFHDPSGNAVPNKQVYANILALTAKMAEQYENDTLSGLCICMYMASMQYIYFG